MNSRKNCTKQKTPWKSKFLKTASISIILVLISAGKGYSDGKKVESYNCNGKKSVSGDDYNDCVRDVNGCIEDMAACRKLVERNTKTLQDTKKRLDQLDAEKQKDVKDAKQEGCLWGAGGGTLLFIIGIIIGIFI